MTIAYEFYHEENKLLCAPSKGKIANSGGTPGNISRLACNNLRPILGQSSQTSPGEHSLMLRRTLISPLWQARHGQMAFMELLVIGTNRM